MTGINALNLTGGVKMSNAIIEQKKQVVTKLLIN